MDDIDPIIVPRIFINTLKSLLMQLDILLTEIEILNTEIDDEQ